MTWLGSLSAGVVAGVLTWAVGMGAVGWGTGQGLTGTGPGDPARRRFLAWAGVGGLAWVAGGAALGRVASKLARPDAQAVQEAAAADLGAEYMELVARAYHPGRSGDLQLLLAPFNSANYENESRSLLPRDPRTSHASVWMYLERIRSSCTGPASSMRRTPRSGSRSPTWRPTTAGADRVRRRGRLTARAGRCPGSGHPRRRARRWSSRS